jgi:branched-subunit amino acid transport protein
MSLALVGLALLMAAVTYPSRAIPLLAPAFERLPARALEYLRLVGPAVLGAIAASQALLVTGADGHPSIHVGIDALAVVACVGLVAWRRNLLLGLLFAVVMTAGVRALGVG